MSSGPVNYIYQYLEHNVIALGNRVTVCVQCMVVRKGKHVHFLFVLHGIPPCDC